MSRKYLNFGPELRRRRMSRGLSLRVVASVLGVSVSLTSKVERGSCTPFGPRHIQLLGVLIDTRGLADLAAADVVSRALAEWSAGPRWHGGRR